MRKRPYTNLEPEMKAASTWIVKALCIIGLFSLATPAYAATGPGGTRSLFLPLVSSGSQAPTGQAPSRTLGWLDYLNAYRISAGLPALSENTSWSGGGRNHAIYSVKNGVLQHSEDPSKPYYTDPGNQAAANSNVMATGNSTDGDINAIDLWLEGPFHALGMLDPRLASTGFGSYRDNSAAGFKMSATLDVLRGLSSLPSGFHFPVMWPGRGSTIRLTSYNGNEFPNPLSPCSGYSAPTGLPVILQLDPAEPASLQAHSFSQGSTPLESCAYNKNSGQLDSTGKSILGMRNAVVLIPRAPLVAGNTYSVSITNGGTVYSWSFSIGN